MISVIVPIYNVEDYLEDCLASILNSTYEDFELILVDDGSTDQSGLICDRFQNQDNRIKVIHKENSGVSDARNMGLDNAHGDYISFIDGDDIIHPKMLEILKAALESGDYDFSMINYSVIEKEESNNIMDRIISQRDNGCREIIPYEFMSGLMDGSTESLIYNFSTNKLYKKSLIEGLRFVTTAIEDLEWNCRVCLRMSKAIYVDQALYYWVQRDTSQLHQGIGERYINRVKSYLLCYKDIPQNYTEFRNRWLERIYKVMLYTREDTKSLNRALYPESNSICKAVYSETKNDLMKSGLGWFKKMVLLSCYRFPLLYSLLRTCYIKGN